MSKVYVITKGEYSDYHICAVATNNEKAEILRNAFSDRWSNAQIEIYETDQFLTEIENGFQLYSCIMDRHTHVLNIHSVTIDYLRDSDFRVGKIAKGTKYRVSVWAKDEDHARKIGADKIAEFIAKEKKINLFNL